MPRGLGATADACRAVGQTRRVSHGGGADLGGCPCLGPSLATHGAASGWLAPNLLRGPRQISDRQLRRLRVLLRQGAVAHGWSNQLWTAGRVAILIERHFGVRYHPEHVRKLLKQRLHWTSQKPQKHARERNDEEVERWIAEEWPRVLRQAVERHAHIALLDESGFMLAPLVRRTLAPRGKTPIVDCSDSHDRISVISAITVSPRFASGVALYVAGR